MLYFNGFVLKANKNGLQMKAVMAMVQRIAKI